MDIVEKVCESVDWVLEKTDELAEDIIDVE